MASVGSNMKPLWVATVTRSLSLLIGEAPERQREGYPPSPRLRAPLEGPAAPVDGCTTGARLHVLMQQLIRHEHPAVRTRDQEIALCNVASSCRWLMHDKL